MCHLQGKHAEAEALYVRAIGIKEKVLGADHPEVATTLNDLALLHKEQVRPVYPHGLRLLSVWIDKRVAGRHDSVLVFLLQNMLWLPLSVVGKDTGTITNLPHQLGCSITLYRNTVLFTAL